MSGDNWNDDEARVGRVFRDVSVPESAIRMRLPTAVPTGSRGRLRPIAISLALALGIGVAGGVLIPRSYSRSASSSETATRPAGGAAAAQRSCQLPAVVAGTSSREYGLVSPQTGAWMHAGDHGQGAWSYVPGLHRWVATGREDVAPDGSAYAYLASDGGATTIHIADAAGDRASSPIAGTTRLLGYTSSGVVYEAARRGGGDDYFVLAPATMATRHLPTTHVYEWGGGGALWRLAGGASAGDTSLVRLDVSTGTETVWFDVNQYLGPEPAQVHSPLPDGGLVETPEDHLRHSIGLLGFDAMGGPVLHFGSRDAGAPTMVLDITAPGQVTAILPRTVNAAGTMDASSATADGSAILLLGYDGTVWQFASDRGLTRLSIAGGLANGTPLIAGPCSN